MKLPNLPFLKKKPTEEFYIALLIKQKSIIAILLSSRNSSLSIIATKSVSVSTAGAPIKELIEASDEAISSIELSLDESQKVEKTIFSVPLSWTDEEGQITKERLLQLKKLSVELALKPMGFIVIMEALIKYFQDKEGVPLSAIFVEESNDKVFLYLVKGGNIIEMQSGEIEGDIEKSVEHTLKKVEKFDTLPSKMILLYHEDIEERHQKFLSFPWTKNLPFLHLPQISIMEKGFENEAVVDAIASQMNARLSDKAEVAGAEFIEGDASSVAGGSENFGFLKEKDIGNIQEAAEQKNSEEEIENFENEKTMSDDDMEKDDEKGGIIPAVLATLTTLPAKALGFFKWGISGPGKLKKLFIPIATVIIFIVLMVVYFLVFLRVEVVVFLNGEEVRDEVVVNLSEEDDTSFSDKILRIDAIQQEVTGSVSKATTGTEEIGESATGEVTIFSSLSQTTEIDSGTVITSSNGLRFTLDDNVNIASSSGVSDLKSVKVSVTADEIGREYNLPSNTTFSVGGFDSSSVEAKNDVAFAGGTKEEKQIVAAADIRALETQLVDELFENAIRVAREKVGSDEEIISVLLESSIENEDYSAAVGDEATNLELEGTIIYTLGVYKKDEAEKFINDAIGGSLPEGLVISEEDSQIRLDEIEQDGGRITGTLIYEVLFKPDVELENLSEELKGKTSQAALDYVKEIEGVSDANIVFKNKLPLLPSILPITSSHIEINLRFEN